MRACGRLESARMECGDLSSATHRWSGTLMEIMGELHEPVHGVKQQPVSFYSVTLRAQSSAGSCLVCLWTDTCLESLTPAAASRVRLQRLGFVNRSLRQQPRVPQRDAFNTKESSLTRCSVGQCTAQNTPSQQTENTLEPMETRSRPEHSGTISRDHHKQHRQSKQHPT